MLRFDCGVLGLTMLMVMSGGCHRQAVSVQSEGELAYQCYRAGSAITVDGRLDEAGWARAEVIERFYAFSPRGESRLSQTRVRMLWDDVNLYVGFECVDDDVWSYSDEADSELWNGDVAEFFIKPDPAGLSYAELVVAPNGTLTDAWHVSRGAGGFKRFSGWSSGAAVGCVVDGTDGDWQDDDRSYVVEIAIPLKAIVGGDEGESMRGWTFGAFRYDYSKSREQPLLMMSMPESLKRGFHYYEGYRALAFVKNIQP